MPAKQGPTVKIKPESKAALSQIAGNVKAQQIDVLAWAIEALALYYKHHGNRLLLPLRFTETFKIYSIAGDTPPPEVLLEPPRKVSPPPAAVRPHAATSRSR